MKALAVAASRSQTSSHLDVVQATLGGPRVERKAHRIPLARLRQLAAEFQPEAVVWAWGSEEVPDLGVSAAHFACSWYDALVAGAFAGQTGLLLVLENEGNSLLVCREEHNQTRSFFNPEGSLSWLAGLAQETLRSPQLGTTSRQRFARALKEADTPLAVFREVQDLADYPGPDPAALALMSKAGRTLCDFCRAGRGRARLAAPIRAAWGDVAPQGPLWEAFQAECKRYLPELRWQAPVGTAALGALLLWDGQRQEDRRLQDLGRAEGETTGMDLDEDAWRHLRRGGRWLEPWKVGR